MRGGEDDGDDDGGGGGAKGNAASNGAAMVSTSSPSVKRVRTRSMDAADEVAALAGSAGVRI